jgi:hypothetical protein
MTNRQLAARLARIVSELEVMGESDMGDLPEKIAGSFHNAVGYLQDVQDYLQDNDREPPDPPGWEGGFAENH